jgi:hypothetical protein
MSSKFKEVTRFFKHKLDFAQVEYTRHTGFRPLFGGRFIGLPTLVRISRGDGDLSPRNFGSLADALGLKERELSVSMTCRISRNTILCALAWRLLFITYHELCHCQEPVAPGAVAMLESVDLLIGEITFDGREKLSSEDIKCQERIEALLAGLVGKGGFGTRATLIRSKMFESRNTM